MSHGHSGKPDARQQRRDVRGVPCPACGRAAGLPCEGSRGQDRFASHQERWDAYRKTKEKNP